MIANKEKIEKSHSPYELCVAPPLLVSLTGF